MQRSSTLPDLSMFSKKHVESQWLDEKNFIHANITEIRSTVIRKYEERLNKVYWNDVNYFLKVPPILGKIKVLPDDFFIAVHNNFIEADCVFLENYPDLFMYAYQVLNKISVLERIFSVSDEHIVLKLLADEKYKEKVLHYIGVVFSFVSEHVKDFCIFPFCNLELGRLVFKDFSHTTFFLNLMNLGCFSGDITTTKLVFENYLNQLHQGIPLEKIIKNALSKPTRACGSSCVIL